MNSGKIVAGRDGTGGRDGTSKVLQEVLADLKSTSQRHWEKVGRAKDRPSKLLFVCFHGNCDLLWWFALVLTTFFAGNRDLFLSPAFLENSHHVRIWVFTLPFVFLFVSAIAFAGLCLCTDQIWDHLLSLEVMLRLLCLSSNLAWMGGTLLIYKKFYCENSEKKGTNDQIETKSTVLNFKTFWWIWRKPLSRHSRSRCQYRRGNRCTWQRYILFENQTISFQRQKNPPPHSGIWPHWFREFMKAC